MQHSSKHTYWSCKITEKDEEGGSVDCDRVGKEWTWAGLNNNYEGI